MSKYYIEQKILTLAECAVMSNQDKPATFDIDDIEFSHLNFNHRDGWKTNYWLAKSCIEASDFQKALKVFKTKISRLIPRISLISQAYIEYLTEPFLIHKESSNQSLIKYFRNSEPVGLMFTENELKALEILTKNEEIPESFYYYWKDAVNTTGYSAKLLLIFSSIEALTKINGNTDFNLIDQILGEKLRIEVYGTKEKSNSALRNRLVHGEYFNKDDHDKNYLEIIHKKIIGYFNTTYFKDPLITETVVNPQRHFFGNRETACWFIKRIDGSTYFDLIDVLDDFDTNGFNNSKKYTQIFTGEEKEKQY